MIEQLAAAGGVASVSALAGRGISPREVDAAVRAGTIRRLRRGWVALPDASALLVDAVTIGGALSCTSLLDHRQVWTAHDDRLHVRVAPHAGHSRSVDRAARLHRSALIAPPRTAFDDVATALACASLCQSRLDAVVSLDSALGQGLVTIAELRRVFAPLSAVHRDHLLLVDPASGSGLETKARLRIRSRRVRLRSQVQIEGVGRVDLLLGDRLVLELDGYRWHSSRTAFEEDRRRDLELARRGYRVLRLSWRQVTFDWDACERVILQLVRAGEHRWPPGGRRA
ncbi:endonuclease domain-containing protein [Herbiconiux sp. VKM Ac-2851]|uniref:endonuclease domain-containing protein n=1 Tax=Herbiconiux sp. VKM Ac-2851 TaxID=2739025 RepID=UPI001566994A|nr:DUF559 domain-containing protein [Herbiconiux sp. VKM Ac-2851]NQX33457.1 DUF559 domain-containing protein [Herbiconiux sp. VKM Ac-2851]